MSDVDFQPWPLIWSDVYIRRFWDYYVRRPEVQENYFSRTHGASIFKQVKRHIQPVGTAVDLGSGPGYLTQLLLEEGLKVVAVDTSQQSIDLLGKRFRHVEGFIDAVVGEVDNIPLEGQAADLVMLVETLEHFSEADLQAVLSEVRRILRRGGHVVVTTPNEEELSLLTAMCPNCGCEFHMMQHVRSLSARSLENLMSEAGFATIACKPTLFTPDSRIRAGYQRVRSSAMLCGVLRRCGLPDLYRQLPHLLYIGQVPG